GPLMNSSFRKSLLRQTLLFQSIVWICVPMMAQVLPGAGASKGKEPVAALAQANEYPQEAVVVEHFRRSFRFENDGSSIAKTHIEYKVQSDAGVQALGVIQLPYNSVSDELKIDYVHVKKQDGVVLNTPTESVQEATTNVSQV